MLRKLLSYKKLNKIDIDSSKRIDVHDLIFNGKQSIKDIFDEWHSLFLSFEKKYFSGNGLRVEFGSGIYPLKSTDKNIISSDIVFSNRVDLILNAENMNLKDQSVKTIFMQNVFHHIGNPEKFFLEANRVLKVGGGIIMIEPYFNFLSSLIYSNISENEFFDKKQASWVNNTKSMSGANQALSHNIFIRDSYIFKNKFGNFEILKISPLNNYLRYLFSGGLNFKQLFPSSLFFILKIIEYLLRPFNKLLAIHYCIVIKKIK